MSTIDKIPQELSNIELKQAVGGHGDYMGDIVCPFCNSCIPVSGSQLHSSNSYFGTDSSGHIITYISGSKFKFDNNNGQTQTVFIQQK